MGDLVSRKALGTRLSRWNEYNWNATFRWTAYLLLEAKYWPPDTRVYIIIDWLSSLQVGFKFLVGGSFPVIFSSVDITIHNHVIFATYQICLEVSRWLHFLSQTETAYGNIWMNHLPPRSRCFCRNWLKNPLKMLKRWEKIIKIRKEIRSYRFILAKIFYRNLTSCVFKCSNKAFAHDVTAAMLVFQFKRILIRLFCLEHQHGRHGFCWVGPWGMSGNDL